MVRFYLVPAVVTHDNIQNVDVRTPKYFRSTPTTPALFSVRMETRNYGRTDTYLVAADLTNEQDALLMSQPAGDVVKFNDNLEDQLGTVGLATMVPALEALNLPAQLLTEQTTYRTTLRGVTAIFAIAQCMNGKGFNIFAPGVTFATTVGDFSVAVRTALQDCYTRLGYSFAGVTLATTVRQLLTGLAQQANPTPMLGVVI